jgi:hypothetical protein
MAAATSSAAIPTSTAAKTTASASTTFAGRLRTSFINSYRSAFKIRTVELGNGIGGFLLRRHLNEPETLASSSVSVSNDRGAFDFARLRKQLLQTILSDRKGKVPYVKLVAHILLSRLPNHRKDPQKRT